MRVDEETHRARPFRVHALARDFDLLDVWRFDVEGGPDGLARFCDQHERSLITGELVDSRVAAALFSLRLWLGRVFGWDEGAAQSIPGCTETSVRDRMPVEARAEPGDGMLFERVYRTDREALYEISNDTVHALMHFGWVERGDGRWGPEMAVYVKPRGWFGRAYMRVIDPLRHLVVYPALMRTVRRRWTAA
ncbi:MAG: DUF2867 domain-containing protein [Sandaracinaceae bacterium]